MSKNTINEEVFENIIVNYSKLEESITNELHFQVEHGSSLGAFRELVWKKLFEAIVPKKFVVAHSVFIIDSYGSVSREVDLAIIDEMYTPYIFRRDNLKFIPVEAVAVAIQCKSKEFDQDDITKWVESIKELQTSDRGIARTIGNVISKEFNAANNQSEKKTENLIKETEDQECTKCRCKKCAGENKRKLSTQTATRPILILCHLSEQSKDGKNKTIEVMKQFDFSLWAKFDNEKKEYDKNIDVFISESFNHLSKAYFQLNHHGEEKNPYAKRIDLKNDQGNDLSFDDFRVRKSGHEVSLLSFNFILNQALMLINNPMFFPHLAYVEQFNRVLKGMKEEG